MSLLDRVHGGLIFPRRVRVIVRHLAEVMPANARVLDVGAGSGLIASSLLQLRPDLEIMGLDVLVRGQTHIPVTEFDGQHIPWPNAAFDTVMLIDTVHHATDPMQLLREAARVASGSVVIKDHLADRFLARTTLRFIDIVGNARYGVALPFEYWPKARWLQAIHDLGLTVDLWRERLGLYPPPASWVFDSSLQFVARLRPTRMAA